MSESYSAWKKKHGRKIEIWVNLKNNVSINQLSSHVIKMASKKARLSETERFTELWDEEESLWNILWYNYNIRQEKKKSVGRMSEKLEMTKIISLKCLFESSFCE